MYTFNNILFLKFNIYNFVSLFTFLSCYDVSTIGSDTNGGCEIKYSVYAYRHLTELFRRIRNYDEKYHKDFSMLDEPGHYMWPGKDTGDTKKKQNSSQNDITIFLERK